MCVFEHGLPRYTVDEHVRMMNEAIRLFDSLHNSRRDLASCALGQACVHALCAVFSATVGLGREISPSPRMLLELLVDTTQDTADEAMYASVLKVLSDRLLDAADLGLRDSLREGYKQGPMDPLIANSYLLALQTLREHTDAWITSVAT
ncbi:MAG: hypothetical protein AAFY46_04800 [Planctomycetota bacterium]